MIETSADHHDLLATVRETAGGPRRRLQVALATSTPDLHAAQRLRHRVFGEEMGATLSSRAPGRDEDIFDAWCEHLVVRDCESGQVVGTYRLLTAERAARLGTFYADQEFDLTRLTHLKARMVEIGRACVDADYRTGAALMLLWHGIAEFMRRRRYDYLVGCASIGMHDGGANAERVYRMVEQRHLAPIEYRVFPRHRLLPREARAGDDDAASPRIPALLKGYLRLGAWIGGEPAWDPDFNTADLFVLLPLARLEARYARRYVRAPSWQGDSRPAGDQAGSR
jgi:putative hemolysin